MRVANQYYFDKLRVEVGTPETLYSMLQSAVAIVWVAPAPDLSDQIKVGAVEVTIELLSP